MRTTTATYYTTQPGELFRLMPPAWQTVLWENPDRAMGGASEMVEIRHMDKCLEADPAYGKGVADALGIPLSKVTGA